MSASQSEQSSDSTSNSPNRNVSRRQLLLVAGLAISGGAVLGDANAVATNTKKRSTKKPVAKKTTKASTSAANCSVIPEETGGPFPGDGTNGANALALKGIVRSDVRSSIVTSNTIAKGVPLKVQLVINSAEECKALAGAAIYIWHCDRDGQYSMYSESVLEENYLRGVQVARSDGKLEFITIVPGAYPGRWPHIHFEVYPNLAKATTGANAIATSQLAFPESMCTEVYTSPGYEASVRNMKSLSLKRDGVFSDGVDQQTPTITGTAATGLTATLSISVSSSTAPLGGLLPG
jgi:protocatechuate 3,4-dioxygenase beta subunit